MKWPTNDWYEVERILAKWIEEGERQEFERERMYYDANEFVDPEDGTPWEP